MVIKANRLTETSDMAKMKFLPAAAILFFLAMTFLAMTAFANTYSGKVVDAATKTGLADVRISYKASPSATAGITDAQGVFSIGATGIRMFRAGSASGEGLTFSPGTGILSWGPGLGAVHVRVRDLHGRQVAWLQPGAASHAALPRLGQGLFTVELTGEKWSHRFRFFNMGSMGAGMPLQLSDPPASDNGFRPTSPMAKSSAASTSYAATDTLVFQKTGYATKEIGYADSKTGLSVELTAAGKAPKSLVFGSPFGSTMDIRGMTGKEKIDVTKEAVAFNGAGSGGIMFFTRELVWDHTEDYSEFKGMALTVNTSAKVIVTVYTGSGNAADGSCTAVADCGAKRYEVSAGTNGVVNLDFASGTALGSFDMAKFRMVALWTGATAVSTLTKLEFSGDAVGMDCSHPGYTLAKNEPPHCKAYVVIGQHADVSQYLNDGTLPAPAGIMTYWEEFGAGTANSYAAVKAEESGMLVNVGVSLKQGAGCASDGGALKSWMGSYWDKTPIFLRVGYEIDNEHANCLGSIKSIFARYRATFADKPNVALVWHTSGFFQDGGTKREITPDFLESVWPGDGNVDWIGISYFTNNWEWKVNAMNVIIAFAKKHGKPIMLAEASVTDNSGVNAATIWDNYFELGIKSLVANPDNRIKMISYIATNWTGNGWTSPFDTDTRFTGGGAIAQQKAKWTDMIETKDAANTFLNKKDIGITNGIISVK